MDGCIGPCVRAIHGILYYAPLPYCILYPFRINCTQTPRHTKIYQPPPWPLTVWFKFWTSVECIPVECALNPLHPVCRPPQWPTLSSSPHPLQNCPATTVQHPAANTTPPHPCHPMSHQPNNPPGNHATTAFHPTLTHFQTTTSTRHHTTFLAHFTAPWSIGQAGLLNRDSKAYKVRQVC